MQKRILALDVGSKRIGVAVTDETNTITTGLGVINRKNLNHDFDMISDYIKKYNAGKIVIGLPLNMKGGKSGQTKKIEGFILKLKKSVDTPVATMDERLTTVQGERLLIQADISRAKRKKVVDKIAAQLILQSYLDSVKQRGDNA